MNWRPENWKTPERYTDYQIGYEDGADAMLKALKKNKARPRVSFLSKNARLRNPQPDLVQTLNPVTRRYVKIDRATGTILSHKRTTGPYKHIPIATASRERTARA